MKLNFNDLLRTLRAQKRLTFTFTSTDEKKFENLCPVVPSYYNEAILFNNCVSLDGSTVKGYFQITPSNLIKAEFKDNEAGIMVETNQGIYDIKFYL